VTFPLSILDLIPLPNDGGGVQAVQNTLELAHLAEALGYHRYWLAEHHNFAGLAAVAPEVLIGVIARETRRIRVGSGGILLPNNRQNCQYLPTSARYAQDSHHSIRYF